MTFAHKIKADVRNVADQSALCASDPDEQVAEACFMASPRVLALGLEWDEGVVGGPESLYVTKAF